MSILELPLEILQLIVEATIPESFENFALSCSMIYHSSSSSLAKYNALKQEFKTFEAHTESELSSSLQLIERIADEPWIARCIVCANFKGDEDASDFDPPPRYNRPRMEANPVRKLCEESTYLKAADINPTKWQQMLVEIESDNPRPCLFLLTLLPNLVELALPLSWGSFPGDPRGTETGEEGVAASWKLIDLIVKNANDPKKPFASLSKLTVIKPSSSMGYEQRVGLQKFVPFLSINSVQKFYTSSCIAIDDGYTGISFNPGRYPTFGQSLEVIELAACVIGAAEIDVFLSKTPKLRSFSYSHETKWHGCGHDWDAGAFMSAIEQNTFETLEELSVGIMLCYGEIQTRVTSMKKFRKLKEIELDIRLLLGTPFIPEDHDPDVETRGNCEQSVSCLLDLLPESTEHFILLTDSQEENINALDRLFVGFADGVGTILPVLEKVTIIYNLDGSNHGGPDVPGRDDDDPRWQRICAALEAVVDGRLMEIEGKGMPSFMRTFYSRFGV